jgi:hypothetical protein
MGTRKSKPTPSTELLHELFVYDQKSGVLCYRKAVKGSGKSAGDEAGYICPTTGYLMVGINYKRYLTHRLIWKMEHGADAADGVDHIDGSKLNNRIENLREANQSQNGANAKLGKGNKSGVKGVFWWSAAGKWQAKIMLHRKSHDLGRYDSIEEAAAAVRDGRERLHGEFARAA